MDSFEKEPNCEHHRIPRNCYLCYLHRNDYDPTKKTTMDTLYETISELKIRITKLEQYARLQADHNNLQREINLTLNAHYTQTCRELNVLQEHRKKQIDENRDLGDRIAILEREIVDIKIYSHPMQEKVWQQNISTRIEQLEQTNQQAIDANPIKDIYERFAKIESKLTMNKWHEYFTSIGKEKELQEYIDAIATGEKLLSKIKTTGLTFEEALCAFKRCEKITRGAWGDYEYMKMADENSFSVDVDDLMATDWKIIE